MSKPIATQLKELQDAYDSFSAQAEKAINVLNQRYTLAKVTMDALVEIIGLPTVQETVNKQARRMFENTENATLCVFNDKVLDGSFERAEVVKEDSIVVGRYSDKMGGIPISVQQYGKDIKSLVGRKIGDKFSILLANLPESTNATDCFEVIGIFDSVLLKQKA